MYSTFEVDLPEMSDFKYETRPYPPRFSDLDHQNRIENAPVPPAMPGYPSSFDDAHIGGFGDQLFDLECQLATSLSKELLSALDAPTQRPLPDFERNKVACLKNAILELKKENDALHRELWKAKCSQTNQDDRQKETEPPYPQPPTVEEHAQKLTQTRNSERDVACQTTNRNLKGHDRAPKSRRSVGGGVGGEPTKSHTQASSHSKCVDWLSRKKSFAEKREDSNLVRLALWQLWELADRALTLNGHPKDDFRVPCLENTTGTETEEGPPEVGDTEAKDPIRANTPPSEIDQLRFQLVRLQRSKDRMERRRDEQTLLLRQKEIQVSRLQRSRQNLVHTFKNQLLVLRQQQAFELKALQLRMQTERASSMAGQTAELDDQLQGAVEQLEERYRALLRDAYNERSKDLGRNSQQASVTDQLSREESGT